MLNVLPSIAVLGAAALAALMLARQRWSPPEYVAERIAAARVFAITVLAQGAHFAEEAATGFHERFGPLLGVPAMPLSFFAIFNLVWLAIWVAAVPGLRRARGGAFFAAWFLAMAGMVNGVAHPLLALAAGGYFPGVVSAPVVGLASLWLWSRLRGATRPGQAAAPGRRGRP